jgi:hypothetical protein
MSGINDIWMKFFRSCDLPLAQCKIYAAAFVRERIQPYMLKDLGKEELKELGVTTLGDQLAITGYIKKNNGTVPEFMPPSSKMRSDATEEQMDMGEEEEVEFITSSSNSKAPDRNEIYHVRMPEGKTPRTKAILEKHAALREQGMIKRGTTGVRVSGINVPKPNAVATNRVSEQSRQIRKKPVMIQDISSSTSRMRSDALVAIATPNIALTRPRDPIRAALHQPAAAPAGATTDFRVRLNMNAPPSLTGSVSEPRIVRPKQIAITTVQKSITQRVQRVTNTPQRAAQPTQRIQRVVNTQQRGILQRITVGRTSARDRVQF